MFQIIIKALENFCIHQIREPYTLSQNSSSNAMYITYIDIQTPQEDLFRVYLALEPEITQTVSTLFLEEDESDEETLIDMVLEMTNLVVGSAKVIAEDSDENHFTIKTPHFVEKNVFNIEYDSIQSLQIGQSSITVAIKAINA